MIDRVGDPTVRLFQQTLDRTASRAAAVAANLANVDTPGYRAIQVEFDEPMGAGGRLPLARTARSHFGDDAADPSAGGRVVETSTDRMRIDGNTVDLDREMTALASLQGRFRATAQMIKKRFALLRYAATDGRG